MAEVEKSIPGQFYYENRSWIRILDFFKQENNLLKNRLAEVVDQLASKDFLALAEQFHNKFIVEDEFIDELRHDINRQLEEMQVTADSANSKRLIKKQLKLRNEMEFFEKEFTTLKNDFNKYMSDFL